MAVVNYHSEFDHYPPAFLPDKNGQPMHSWRVLLLPYLDERELYDKYDFSQPWNSESNSRLAKQMPAVYGFHGQQKAGSVVTNYLAVMGENTMWPGAAQRITDEITDRFGDTILVVENAGLNVHWMEPRDLDVGTMSWEMDDPHGVSSDYQQPAVVMLDGSLRRLDLHLPKEVLQAMFTTNGGETLALEGETWRLIEDGRLREKKGASP